jgi:DMSO/TMAO reductase YedYZ molybdopterin-dependent catalytic subunit
MSGLCATRLPARAAMFGAALSLCGCLAAPVFAADASSLAITGQVQHPETLTRADIEKRPPTTIQVTFQTASGPEEGSFTGAPLWPLLGDAGPINPPGKNTRLRHTILVTGRDGYAVALSYGELDPDYEGKSVILAYAKDGKPLAPADGIRLIIPGDHHGGRDVRDVVTIEVR